MNIQDNEKELEEKRKAAHREAQKRYRERKKERGGYKNADIDGTKFDKYEYDKDYLKNKYSQIAIRIPIEFRNKVDEHIKETGEPITQFVKRAINETIERDNKE